MSLQMCNDTSEAIALEATLGLYLKPASKIKISVQLPKLKTPGQSISSWQLMEKLKTTVRPDQFLYLKALKITSAVIKFEGELETRASCERALARLKAAGGLKLNGFSEWLQIRAAHATSSGPTRHDWDSFFRDARGVDEMKPGERPDTVYLQELPVRWFAETGKPMKPSERLLQKAFATYGRIRRLEIPANHETEERTFGKTSSLHRDLLFEAYIQYEEYVEFAMAMDSLRGKKLLYKDADGKVYSADIKVDFDRTNYLSERCIKKREAEAKKANTVCVSQLPNVAENVSLANVQNVQSPIESSKIQKEDIQQNLVEQKEVENEAKLLLKELLHRAEITERKKEMEKKMKLEKSALKQLEIKTQKKEEIKLKEEKKTREKLIQKEIILKEKLLRNLKAKEEEKIIETREKLRKELAGRRVLKSVLANRTFNTSTFKKNY